MDDAKSTAADASASAGRSEPVTPLKSLRGAYTREYVEWYLTEIGDTSSALNDLDPLLARQIAEYQREKATESGGLG